MAFLNRIGNALKQTGIKHSELSASNSSFYQAIRCMSSAKLFIGGLSYGTDEVSLREAFAQYGEVVEARVIMDRETGRSRGFGFVSYTSSEQASSALQAMDGQDLHGRRVRVNFATDKPRAPGFGNYGGGPGFGGGSYGGGGSNYGGGNYGSGGSGYGGGNYGSGGGNYGSGGSGYGSGNYGSGGGSYGSGGNDFGGGNYGSRGADVSGYGGGSDTGFGGGSDAGFGDSGMPSGGFGSTAGAPPVYGSGVNENIGQNESLGRGSYRTDDGDDEPDDYANTRG